MRLFLVVLAAIGSASCALRPAQKSLLEYDWNADKSFMAKVELQQRDDSYFLRLDMTSTLQPCLVEREDGTLGVVAILTLRDGTELKGKSARVAPENNSSGVYHSSVEVTFSKTASHSKAEKLLFEVERRRETCSMRRFIDWQPEPENE